MAQCTAKSKRSGERCKRGATPGRNVCHIHGGKSLAGPASPTFQTGRYSKLLPARLADRYQQARADTELLALRDEIALLDARLGDVLGTVDTGESSKIWKELQAANSELQIAVAAKDNARVNRAVREISRLIDSGSADVEAWNDVYNLLDQRRRLVESERKRLVELQQYMTAEKAMTLLSVVLDTIQTHVTDRSILAAISADFRKLTAINAVEGS